MRKSRFALGTVVAVALAAACTFANPLGKYQADKGLPDAPPQVSPGEAASPVDDGGSWHIYALDWTAMTWSAPKPLSEVWTGPNAPPSRDIVTAVQLVDFRRLIVFARDGYAYVQTDDGTWRPRAAITDAWKPLSAPPEAAYHVPYAFLRTVAPDAAFVEGITFVDPPNASAFHYTPDDQIVFDEQRKIDPSDGGPPLGLAAVWSFEVLDLTNPDPGAHWRNYTLYADGKLYEFRADFAYSSQPATESAMWKDKADAPPPASLMAAWFDESTKTAYFAGP